MALYFSPYTLNQHFGGKVDNTKGENADFDAVPDQMDISDK